MTKLYKNTGIEYEIEYPPPPEPPPPAPDPEVAAPPGEKVDGDGPKGKRETDREVGIWFLMSEHGMLIYENGKILMKWP